MKRREGAGGGGGGGGGEEKEEGKTKYININRIISIYLTNACWI